MPTVTVDKQLLFEALEKQYSEFHFILLKRSLHSVLWNNFILLSFFIFFLITKIDILTTLSIYQQTRSSMNSVSVSVSNSKKTYVYFLFIGVKCIGILMFFFFVLLDFGKGWIGKGSRWTTSIEDWYPSQQVIINLIILKNWREEEERILIIKKKLLDIGKLMRV